MQATGYYTQKGINHNIYQKPDISINMNLIIYDTTLRDGRQDPRLLIDNKTRLEAVSLLDKFGIDYIELCWPITEEDIACFKEAEKIVKHSRLVAFCSTRKISNKAEDDYLLNTLIKTGTKYAALFGKTWKEHIIKQLKATPEQNLEAIKDSIAYLKKNNIKVFYDAEHFFDGFKDDKEYALLCLTSAIESGAEAIILCDTNGGCLPDEIEKITKEAKEYLKKYPNIDLGIHCHNDSGCAVANTNAAINNGIILIQGTIGGIGERTGNADLCSVIPNAVFKQKHKTNNKINLKEIKKFNKEMHELLGININKVQPYVGESAFAHNGGVHVDAVIKGASYNHLSPESVGNISRVCLTNNSGRAAVIDILNSFNYPNLNKEDKRVKAMLDEIQNMANKGYNISILEAEHYLLAKKFFGDYKEFFSIEDWMITSMRGKDSFCKVWGAINNQKRDVLENIKGGPVDAAYKAIKKLINNPLLEKVHLVHYGVEIPKTGSQEEESSVNVYITFRDSAKDELNQEWTTVGNNPNILEASIEAISKGFRYYLLKAAEN